jgi:Flp pilus assembly protein TadD
MSPRSIFSRPALLGCFAVFAALPVHASTEPAMQPILVAPARVAPQQPLLPIRDVDALFLSAPFKAVLDERIAPIDNPYKRAQALHELLFNPEGYYIGYHSRYTRTAMETLNFGSGNCVSLANLYIAAARHVGLTARFQESHAEQWEDISGEGNYDVLAGHVNVLVKLGKRKNLTVEFLDAYIGRPAKTRVISDEEARAHHYNNLGMNQLHENNLPRAHQYLTKAIATFDDSPVLWSNLGVVEKRLGDRAAAERAYLTAMDIDKDYPSAAKNLYILYKQDNQPLKAQKYAAIVEEHNRRNPYHLNRLAGQAMDNAKYERAISLLKRAVKIKKEEDRFHFALAQAYYQLGDVKRAKQALKKAREFADDPHARQRYNSKLATLNSLSTSGG